MKVAVRRQIAVMKKLGEKFMSDEETDDDDNSVLIKRSLPWRSSALNKLILKLDCAYLKKKDNSKPSKKRVDGSWSNRAQPVNAPIWAVVQIDETPTAGNSDVISEREQLVDSGNDADESALNTSICTTSSSIEVASDEFNNDNISDDDNDDELNDIFEAVTGTTA